MGAEPISFGPFTLDRDAQSLSSGGKSVAIGQRAFALLEALATADGPVSKADLIEAAWPGMIVEDGNLSVQIAALRKALGTRPDGGDWIVTVSRVGYRLLRAAMPSELSRAQHRPQLPSIAVLPFQNMSSDPEQDYFADGIAEDIITALGRFRTVGIVARDSSFVYKGKSVDIREVGAELGVRYVLQGSVRRAGGRLRISAQLADCESGQQLWAEHFDGSVEEVFVMQDSVTANVVAIVEPSMRRAEIERARRKHPENLDAYDLYLKALPDVFTTRANSSVRALALLNEALAKDPDFAPALAMLATVYMLRHAMQLTGADGEDANRSVALARRALDLGTDDPQAVAMCGHALLQCGGFYDEALAVFQRAVDDNPNNAMVLTQAGIACLLGGDLEEGDARLMRALALNPNDFGTSWLLTGIAHIRMAQGRYQEAVDYATRALAVNDGYDAAYWMLIAGNAHLGRLDQAKQALAGLCSISPGVTLSRIRRGQKPKDPHRIDVLIEGMRIAGLPE